MHVVRQHRSHDHYLPKMIESYQERRGRALGSTPSGPSTLETRYSKKSVHNEQEASNSGTMVTGTLLLNSKPFSILFDSGATHSFISTRAASPLNLGGN